MTRQLAKLLELLWYVSMGLCLGLAAGTILAVVETFDSSRKIDAAPQLEPYGNERFESMANEVVAGYIAQNLFLVGGIVALCLLGLALLMRLLAPLVGLFHKGPIIGSRALSIVRGVTLAFCVGLMSYGALNMWEIRQVWPTLYEVDTDQSVLNKRRDNFDRLHDVSERVVRTAWFAGALALIISPWCRRIVDSDLQSGDGQEDEQKENHA